MWILALLLAQAPDLDRFLLLKGDPPEQAGPLVVLAIAPVFPDGLTTGPSGESVVLEAEVNGNGRTARIRILEGGKTLTHEPTLRALAGWRFRGSGKDSTNQTVRITFMYRTMPMGTPPEGLTTIFRGKYEIEVRALVRTDEPPTNQMRRPRPREN